MDVCDGLERCEELGVVRVAVAVREEDGARRRLEREESRERAEEGRVQKGVVYDVGPETSVQVTYTCVRRSTASFSAKTHCQRGVEYSERDGEMERGSCSR